MRNVGFCWSLIEFVISFILSFVMFNSHNSGHSFIPFLPFFHSIITLLSSKSNNFIFSSPSVSIIKFTYFIRNVLTPYLLSFGDYYSFNFIVSEVEIKYAVLLMSYETLCLYMYMSFDSVTDKLSRIQTQLVKAKKKAKNVFPFDFIFILVLLFVSAVMIVVPGSTSFITTIFNPEAAIMLITEEEGVARGFVMQVIMSLYSFAFEVVRIALPAFIIFGIYKLKTNDTIKVLFSIIIATTQLLIITERTMISVINIIVLILLLLRLYKAKKKMILLICGVPFVCLVLFLLVSKTGDGAASGADYFLIGSLLQSYIPGVFNTAGVFDMTKINATPLIADIYTMIPFHNAFYPKGFGDTSLDIFRDINNAGGQILPTIGQGYFLFTSLFAPILTILMARIAFYFDSKMLSSDDYWHSLYYVKAMVFAAVTPTFYYIGVFGQTFFTSILPILFLSYFSTSKYCISSKHQ